MHKLLVIIGGPIALLALFAGTVSRGDDLTDANADARLQRLTLRLEELEAELTANGRDHAATIDAILRDADRRSQMLGNLGDTSAGYDNGFYLRSGDFLFRPSAVFQF